MLRNEKAILFSQDMGKARGKSLRTSYSNFSIWGTEIYREQEDSSGRGRSGGVDKLRKKRENSWTWTTVW